MSEKIEKTEEEWKQTLTPEQYHVLRQKGTANGGRAMRTGRNMSDEAGLQARRGVLTDDWAGFVVGSHSVTTPHHSLVTAGATPHGDGVGCR